MKMLKRIYLFPILVALVVGLFFSFSKFTPSVLAFSGIGAGTEISPFEITTCAQLLEINDSLSSEYIILNDIDCEGVAWSPIGPNPGAAFSGVLDGGGNTVSNVSFVTASGGFSAGLFGSIEGGTVLNLYITGLEISAPNYSMVGGLAGTMGLTDTADALIDNVSISGTVLGTDHVGGFVGNTMRPTDSISNSSGTLDVTGVNEVGGFVGTSYINVSDSTATVSVSSTNGGQIGGLAGLNYGNIEDCTFVVDISYITTGVSGSDIGGLVGKNYGDIDGCSTSGSITRPEGNGNFIGGLIGESLYDVLYPGNEVSNCSSSVNINTVTSYTGGLIGWTTMRVSSSFASGNVISTNSISGGLIGQVGPGSADLDNMTGLHATGDVYGDEYVGGLIGSHRPDGLSNCYATGDVFSVSGSAGGLLGDANSTITNSYATGDVTSQGVSIGGLIGYTEGSTNGCYATGDVLCNEDFCGFVGGLLGESYFDILSSYATGDVTVLGNDTEAIGGLVGAAYLDNEVFTDSYATGDVLAAGGTGVGGLAGLMTIGNPTRVYALGDVTGLEFVGGLIGLSASGDTTDAYALGSVASEGVAGGLIGSFNDGILTNAYSKGFVSGTTTGGLVGNEYDGEDYPNLDIEVVSSYYDYQTSGQSDVGKGTPKTSVEIAAQLTYIGWDFEDVWSFDSPLNASANPAGGGSINTTGQFLNIPTFLTQRKNIVLTTTPNTNYTFVNWTKNGDIVSTTPSYSFSYTNADETGPGIVLANFSYSYVPPVEDPVEDPVEEPQVPQTPTEVKKNTTSGEDTQSEPEIILMDDSSLAPPVPEETTPDDNIITPPIIEDNGSLFEDISKAFKNIREFVLDTSRQVKSIVDSIPISQETATTGAVTSLSVVAASSGASVLLGGTYIQGYIIKVISLLLGVFRIGRKKRGFGVVYDSITKEPLNGAIIRVYDEKGTLKSTEVSNKYGIFELSLPDGTYTINTQISNYQFPSSVIQSGKDLPYEDIYHGEKFTYSSSQDINFSIPMDSLKVSIEESVSSGLKNIFVNIFQFLIDVSVFLGFVFSAFSYIKEPNSLNTVLLLVYLLIILLNILLSSKSRYKFGKVIDSNGETVEGVQIGLLENQFGRVFAKRVTNEKGEYRFLVEPGEYRLVSLEPEYSLKEDMYFAKGGNGVFAINKDIRIVRK